MDDLQVEFHTAEEQAAILAAIKAPDKLVRTLLMMDGGGRVSEIRTLKWDRCDFRKRAVTLKTGKQRGKDKHRTIPMSDRLYAAFDELIRERQKKGKPLKGYVFPSPKDETRPIGRSAVNMQLRRLGDEVPQAGKLKPHKLRHTAATNLAANGAETYQIRDFLGHSDSRVTDIYTHADPEHLRVLINASTPKPSFWERWKARFMPRPRSVINLLTVDTDFIVGRDKERRQIQDAVSRGLHVWVAGPVGSGKTHLLDTLTFAKPTLVIDDCAEFKKSMVAALLHICGDKETAGSMLYQTSDPAKLETKISAESLPNIIKAIKVATRPGEYLLKVGHIDHITPTVIRALESLKDHFTLLVTARSISLDKASLVSDFVKIDLQPLSRPDSLKLIYRLIGDLPVADLDAVMTKLYETADGNPRKLRELCERLRREPYINLDTATEVADGYLGRQTEEIDFSIILLFVLGGFVLLRYIGRVTGEKDLQFVGACIMFVVMFARFFFRSQRRRTL